MSDIHDHVQIEQALKTLGLVPDDGDVPPIIIGEANDGANVGDGEGEFYQDKVGVTLNFRTLKAGAGIVVNTDTENHTVDISATGIGAGDVEGTPPSFLDAFAIYADTTGLKIKNSNLRHKTSANELMIQGKDPNDLPTWLEMLKLEYVEPNGVPGGTSVVLGNALRSTQIRAIGGNIYVDISGKRVLHEAIPADWDLPKPGSITNPGNDTVRVLKLITTGTNPGASEIHIGNRNPEGNVTANQGAVYVRQDGDNSAFYFKKTGVGNTGWADFSVGVAGPVSATDLAIAIFDGTTGKIIKNSPTKIIDISNQHKIQFDDPNAPGTYLDAISAIFTAPNGVPGGTQITIGNLTRTTVILSAAGTIYSDISGKQVLHEAIPSEWALPKAGSITQTVNDTVRVLELINTGTNAGSSKIHVGDRTPESNVTAEEGAIYIRDNGSNSSIYVKETGTGNTGWSNVINPNVGFYAFRTTGNQTLLASVEAKVAFPNKQDDPGGDFDEVTNYVFTAPTKGTYAFAANANITVPSKGIVSLRLYHNTTMVAESSSRAGAAATISPLVAISRRQMNATDTMEVRAFQTATNPGTIQNTGLNFNGVQLRRDL